MAASPNSKDDDKKAKNKEHVRGGNPVFGESNKATTLHIYMQPLQYWRNCCLNDNKLIIIIIIFIFIIIMWFFVTLTHI
jgi:hypothetical protein